MQTSAGDSETNNGPLWLHTPVFPEDPSDARERTGPLSFLRLIRNGHLLARARISMTLETADAETKETVS